jgi:hypothetical protein
MTGISKIEEYPSLTALSVSFDLFSNSSIVKLSSISLGCFLLHVEITSEIKVL